jgi:tetratricopeptide (TPR) repeat protein
LYEREEYPTAALFMDTALSIIADKCSLAFASTLTLKGFIDLDLNKPKTALISFRQALAIRYNVLDPHDELIGSSLNAISLSYTEMNELDLAEKYGWQAIEIRLDNQSPRIGNSYSNMASTLLRRGLPDDAEEMLRKCPLIKDFTDKDFLYSKNPRFSGYI